MDDLIERLRANGLDECDEAIARIEALEARVAAADKLAEAGSVMSRALQGDYIVPGSAAKWDAALAAYEATKEGGACARANDEEAAAMQEMADDDKAHAARERMWEDG